MTVIEGILYYEIGALVYGMFLWANLKPYFEEDHFFSLGDLVKTVFLLQLWLPLVVARIVYLSYQQLKRGCE